MDIRRYTPEMRQQWDDFVRTSRNGTFLFLRGYMDYHSDRFRDCSLVIKEERGEPRAERGEPREERRDGNIVALFPAAVSPDGSLASHGGLTYGGLLLPDAVHAPAVVGMLEAIASHYRAEGFKSLRYKAIPHIYHRYPCEEDIYALFRQGASLVETNISSAIDLSCPLPFSRTQRYHANRAEKSGITVSQSVDYAAYWNILSDLLESRYSTKPVHSLDEIKGLAAKFPENIKLYVASDSDGELLAGTVMYICGRVAHAQYIAASPRGKQQWALPLLFREIVAEYKAKGLSYFDFGISNENHGLYLNEGLVSQKCQFGGRGIAYNIFELPL